MIHICGQRCAWAPLIPVGTGLPHEPFEGATVPSGLVNDKVWHLKRLVACVLPILRRTPLYERMKWGEIRNARLAMLAFLGFNLQYLATGKSPIDNLVGEATYATACLVVIVTYRTEISLRDKSEFMHCLVVYAAGAVEKCRHGPEGGCRL